jgi:hypothetical protein
MKIFAALLALLTAMPPAGRAQEAVAPSTSAVEISQSSSPVAEPLTVTATRINERAALETARTAGAGAAVAGTGLMAYAVFFAAGGPVGWAAALIFMGGMTAYLSHRRLTGKQDFSWSAPPPPAQTPPKAAKP